MGWKDLPTWLKGGIIGIFIMIILRARMLISELEAGATPLLGMIFLLLGFWSTGFIGGVLIGFIIQKLQEDALIEQGRKTVEEDCKLKLAKINTGMTQKEVESIISLEPSSKGWKEWPYWLKGGIIGTGIAIVTYMGLILISLFIFHTFTRYPLEAVSIATSILFSAISFGLIGLIIDTRKYYFGGIIALVITFITELITGGISLPDTFWKTILLSGANETMLPMVIELYLGYLIGILISWLIGKRESKQNS